VKAGAENRAVTVLIAVVSLAATLLLYDLGSAATR
jgi:hypothetical protein